MDEAVINLLKKNETDFSFNKIYFFSLLGGESGSCRRIYDDVSNFCIASRICDSLPFFKINSKEKLFMKLSFIKEEAKNGVKPVFHIEAHGNPDDGLTVNCTKENISWTELLDKFRKINDNCANNLCVIAPCCYALKMSSSLERISQTSPYYFLLAPSEVIKVRDVEKIVKFYEILIEDSSHLKAWQEVKDICDFYLSEEIFLRCFRKYYRSESSDEAKEKRKKRLIAELIKRTKDPTKLPKPEVLNSIVNSRVNDFMTPFNYYKNKFLMADHPDNSSRFCYSFEDFKNEMIS